MTPKRAKAVYIHFWGLVADARTEVRRTAMKPKEGWSDRWSEDADARKFTEECVHSASLACYSLTYLSGTISGRW